MYKIIIQFIYDNEYSASSWWRINWHWRWLPIASMILGISFSQFIMASESTSINTIKGDEGCQLVIFGASYAGSWDTDKILGCDVVNSGVGGNETVDMLNRFDRDVATYNPDMVLIWGFINDISRSDPENIEATKEIIRRNFIEIIKKTTAIGAKPILATEITLGFPPGIIEALVRWKNRVLGKMIYQQFVNGHVMDVNKWVMKYSSENKIPLLDFHEVLSDEGGNRQNDFVQHDGSHVSLQGYEILTRYVVEESTSGSLAELRRF